MAWGWSLEKMGTQTLTPSLPDAHDALEQLPLSQAGPGQGWEVHVGPPSCWGQSRAGLQLRGWSESPLALTGSSPRAECWASTRSRPDTPVFMDTRRRTHGCSEHSAHGHTR